MKIHPKAAAAAGGAGGGTILVTLLGLLGAHLSPELAAVIATVLSAAGGWLAPANTVAKASK
jgi:hypothetical protein